MTSKIVAALAAALMVVASPAMAQSVGTSASAEAELHAEAGVGPGSVFYGLDRAMERVELALATNADARAEIHLKHAEERLAELEAVSQTSGDSNTTEDAEVAAKVRAGYEESVDAAREESVNASTETRAEVRSRLQTHINVLESLRTRFESDGTAGLVGIETALQASGNAAGSIGSGSRSNSSAEGSAGASGSVSVGSSGASASGSATVNTGLG